MLSQLSVQNFALVDQLELEFLGRMTVVTGETGTGKSIMLDALGLALGDRSETGYIGNHAEKAEIHAGFDLSDNQNAINWLTERELATNQPECILRRVIGKDGRSRGYINGAPSTVNDMKVLGEMLIDIHSQHEHQSLLRRDTQRRLLDEFAGAIETANSVAGLFHEYKRTTTRLYELTDSNEAQTARLQLLSYQAKELKQLKIEPREHESLEVEQKKLANAESILIHCNDAIEMCLTNDQGSVIELLSKTVQQLESIDIKDIHPIAEMLGSARIQVEEAIHDLESYTSDFEIDPVRLGEVEDRLTTIYDLCRKHRVEPNEIQQLEQQINAELESLNNIDNDIAELEHAAAKIEEAYSKEARKLSSIRKQAADKLRAKVSKQLADLGMPGATFLVELTSSDNCQPSVRGAEEIEFLISTNPGQEPRALNKIASGGELSRISLAIQVVTADTSQVPTLIFDEVDVGIGGAVAEVVGSLLRKLGHKAQIICVTHLPQVAAQGHQHLRVVKLSDKQQNRTEIEQLNTTEKVEEIARMLGGIEMTDQSMAHAEEMFNTAQI